MGPRRETSTVRERSWRWLGVAGVVEGGDALAACRVFLPFAVGLHSRRSCARFPRYKER